MDKAWSITETCRFKILEPTKCDDEAMEQVQISSEIGCMEVSNQYNLQSNNEHPQIGSSKLTLY